MFSYERGTPVDSSGVSQLQNNVSSLARVQGARERGHFLRAPPSGNRCFQRKKCDNCGSKPTWPLFLMACNGNKMTRGLLCTVAMFIAMHCFSLCQL